MSEVTDPVPGTMGFEVTSDGRVRRKVTAWDHNGELRLQNLLKHLVMRCDEQGNRFFFSFILSGKISVDTISLISVSQSFIKKYS